MRKIRFSNEVVAEPTDAIGEYRISRDGEVLGHVEQTQYRPARWHGWRCNNPRQTFSGDRLSDVALEVAGVTATKDGLPIDA